MSTITLTIPMPPSVNRIWRTTTAGKVYKAPAYVAWQRTAGWAVMATRPGRFPKGTKLAVTILAGKPKRARDVDNLSKAILDLLQGLSIIDDDRNVVDLRIAWDIAGIVQPGHVQVQAREMESIAA